jgi:hypothetical protein
MAQSITTKYLSPTDTQGSRIKATASGAGNGYSHTHHYDYALGTTDNHIEAAKALVIKLQWDTLDGPWTGGGYKDGGMVFVHDSGDNFTFDDTYLANARLEAERAYRANVSEVQKPTAKVRAEISKLVSEVLA